MRGALNKSLSDYTEWKNDQEQLEKIKSESRKKKEDEQKDERKKEAKKTTTGKSLIGLGKKWGKYNQLLKYKGETEFVQYVPVGSETIAKGINSQTITDTQYNPNKAFWISDEKKYKINGCDHMAKMKYTFSSIGAKSLMEDYLICGSGDFNDDNEEEWTGETFHPDYTIWKTNEIGAYGIGKNRLKQLEKYCLKIEVENPKLKK